LFPPRDTVAGTIELTLTGPLGVYTIFASSNLAVWSDLGAATNTLGSVVYTEASSNLSLRRFYRALPQSPPDMVFIRPN
jgi:hypothetical protein